jgi:hypothetical protein
VGNDGRTDGVCCFAEVLPGKLSTGSLIPESYGSSMRRITIFFLLLLVLVLGGGFVFLATWEIPAPSKQVEKVLDDDRFPR